MIASVLLGALIFDLDGTITKPFIDFDAIRAEIGIASGTILEALEGMSESQRARAEEIILEHEWEAAREGEVYKDATFVIQQCRCAGYLLGIVTRNARQVVDFLLEKHGLRFDAIRTREDGSVKPSPAPVLSVCSELGVEPSRSWMIGDFLYDIESGRAAGCQTVLMAGDEPLPHYAGMADFTIRRLSELPAILGIAAAA